MFSVPQNLNNAKKASLLSTPIDKVENSDQFQPPEFDPNHNTCLAVAKNRPKHGSKAHRDGDHVESRASEKAAEKADKREAAKEGQKKQRPSKHFLLRENDTEEKRRVEEPDYLKVCDEKVLLVSHLLHVTQSPKTYNIAKALICGLFKDWMAGALSSDIVARMQARFPGSDNVITTIINKWVRVRAGPTLNDKRIWCGGTKGNGHAMAAMRLVQLIAFPEELWAPRNNHGAQNKLLVQLIKFIGRQRGLDECRPLDMCPLHEAVMRGEECNGSVHFIKTLAAGMGCPMDNALGDYAGMSVFDLFPTGVSYLEGNATIVTPVLERHLKERHSLTAGSFWEELTVFSNTAVLSMPPRFLIVSVTGPACPLDAPIDGVSFKESNYTVCCIVDGLTVSVGGTLYEEPEIECIGEVTTGSLTKGRIFLLKREANIEYQGVL